MSANSSTNWASGSTSLWKETLLSGAFRISQAFPQILAIRTSPRAWLAFRIFLGIAGAALIILPLGFWNAWLFAPVGLVFFMLAVLLPPVTESPCLAHAVKQLHAYSVLDGGKFHSGEDVADLRLLLAKDRIWGLDEKLRPLLVIPVADFHALKLDESDGAWLLELGWAQNRATFIYEGLFAERRARLAASALQRIVHSVPAAETKPKARAAGAGRSA